jgi:hypothetical protein
MKTANCKRPGWFRCASFGDVHLGHPNTPTEHIIRNLMQYIHEDLIKDLDMLIIEGDLFDRLLNSADDNIFRIQRWATQLMWWCAKHGTMLDIVEGTPSHDWFQCKFFVEQKQNAEIPVDLYYSKGLSIRYIEKFDMHVLYVPDHCLPHPDDILKETRLQMAKLGITQVDFAVMHGAFTYQYPVVVVEPTHDEQTYLDLVKYFIFIGHVHQSSQYERILAAGSFDRLNHGDEGYKGFYDVSVQEDGTHRITFVINHHAKRYDTLDCRGADIKDINVTVQKHMEGLRKGSSIRLRCYQGDPAVAYVDALKREYSEFEWVNPVVEDAKSKTKKSVVDVLANIDMSTFLPINEHSFLELLKPELEKHSKDPVEVQRCLRHADNFLLEEAA